MAREDRNNKRKLKLIPKGSLNAEEAEKLFATVDDTGHTSEETALTLDRRRARRAATIDPLSDADPSGSDVGKRITRTAIIFVVVLFVVIIGMQVVTGLIRRATTADLANDVNIDTVYQALDHGVGWGTGFTQFPTDFSVQEADENTHRIEVTVTDTSSKNALESFAGSQIQAAAFSVNALLNPNINTVIFHVEVYEDEEGELQQAGLFGLLKPAGSKKTLMTFIWSKTTTEDNGVRFNCTITGVDAQTAAQLQESITSSFTPEFITNLMGSGTSSSDETTSGDSKADSADADASATGTSADGADADGSSDATGAAGTASGTGSDASTAAAGTPAAVDTGAAL